MLTRDVAIARLSSKPAGQRTLLRAVLEAAYDLAEVRSRHDEAFIAFLVDMDGGEDAWDAYIIELGRAERTYASMRHWAQDRIEGCDREDPGPGCLCYECGEWYADDDHGFYARAPRFTSSQAMRAGLVAHTRFLLQAIGG